MNSNEIFEYSDEFFNEIIDDLIELKIENLSNPKNNDFDNKLKLILGKNFKIMNLMKFISDSDENFKEKIIKKFKEIEMKELSF